MNILYVSSRFPYPLTRGDKVRAYNQLRLLSSSHSVTLVSPVSQESQIEFDAVRPYCDRIIPVNVKPLRQALKLMRAPVSTQPFQTLYFFPSELQEEVAQLAQTNRFDIAHFQTIRMAPAAMKIKETVPTVIDLIDALSLNMKRRAERERFRPLAWLVNMEADRVARYERELLQATEQLVVCSSLDKAAISDSPKIKVVTQGVDLDRFTFSQSGRDEQTIVFSGSMWYFPNSDAAAYFAEDVFPRIRAHMPHAKFQIVGGGADKRIEQLKLQPGVELTGYTANVHTYLAKATLAVAPMRSGSGMQFKVIEAMASGTPVVVTPFALGGLNVIPGEHLVVAQDAQSFADAVIDLLKWPEKRRQLAIRARALVEQNYTWERSVEQLEAVYTAAITPSSRISQLKGG